MRLFSIAIVTLFFISICALNVNAESKRIPRGMSGYKYKEAREKDKVKEEKDKEKEEGKETKEAKEEQKGPLTPQDVLKLMLRYEYNQGILDYSVDVIEVTERGNGGKTESIEKEIYFLATSRFLTLKDEIPIYYIDEYLFEKIMKQVSIDFMDDEKINEVDCYVMRMKPLEKPFEKNLKYYHVAKDDYRKIRIESTRHNAQDVVIYNVTDFQYRRVDGKYTVPLRSESRIYDQRDFLLQSTTATFMNWKFNTGLTSAFFDEKLKDYKLYDIVK